MAFERKPRPGSGVIPELGAIFMCNRATKEMCFSWNTFGLPYSNSSFVKQVKAGMFLFLFEYETRKLYGVYQASTDGTVNFTSKAFSSAGKQYPAQVKFGVVWDCTPLSEDEFRPVIEDNYYTAYKFKFGLSRNQVWELLLLFSSRKLGDALQRTGNLPNDPSLIRGATRSPIIDDAGKRIGAGVQNQNLLENANSPVQNRDLENFFLPNRAVDSDHGNADADTVLPNYRRDFSPQGRVVQVRDMMYYSCKSNNDHELDSGVPCMPNNEVYDPDAPLLNDITAVQHLQRCREEWDERVYTENDVDGRPHFSVSEVESITHPIHVSSGMQYGICDNLSGPLSQYCNSTPNIGKEMALNVIRQQPSATCYIEPIAAKSRSSCPGYPDSAIDKGPILYHPDSSSPLQGMDRCSEDHLKADFFRDSNISINGELSNIKPLSEMPSDIDDTSIMRQPAIYFDSSRTISHPNFSSGTKLDGDPVLPTSLRSCAAAADSHEAIKICKRRQSVPLNKRSVFSRLKPALDADDEDKLEDPRKSIDDMVSEVMETLKGHYCQLVRESNLAMDKVSDDDDNKREFKKYQTLQCQAANHELPIDLPTAYTKYNALTGTQINGESSRLSFKRRSEARKTCSGAEDDLSSAILAEKQCKRRKLVRPSSDEKKLSNKDYMADNVSENLSFSCQPIQDGLINTDVPLLRDKEQNPLEAGNLGSLVLATGVGDEFRNVIADINMGSESAKHEAQPFTNPSVCDPQHLPKQCSLGSVVLDVSLGGKSSSRQSTSNREDCEGAELSLAIGADEQKDDHRMLENTIFGLPPKGILGHVKEISSNMEFSRSSQDPNHSDDEESMDCTLPLNLMMFSGDQKPGNTVCCDVYGDVKSDNIGDPGVSTEMELPDNGDQESCWDASKCVKKQ